MRDTSTLNPDRAGGFEGRAKRQAMRVIRKIVGIALFFAGCMWAFILWPLWSEYSAAGTYGRTEGYNLAAAFASELTVTFDRISAALRIVGSTMAGSAPAGLGVAQLRDAVVAAAGQDADVLVAGPDGHLLFSTLAPGMGPAEFADAPHFIAHRERRDAGLIVDPPRADAAGNRINVSLRLEAAGGRFIGEAMVLVKPAGLVTLNRVIDLGSHGMIAIAGIDGIVLAGFDRAHPDGLAWVGTDLHGAAYPDQLEPGTTTVYTRRGKPDGVEQLVTIRGLEGYPLRVLVGLDSADLLGPARRHLWLMGVSGFGATGLIGALTVLLIREVWRRTLREIDLAYDRARLIAARAQIGADRARLDEANRALQASKASADAANQARSQFLAHMSHELRTPLHAIIGFSELIQDQAPGKPGVSAIAGYAADIWSSGRHLLELINTILDISKVESGTVTLTETAFLVDDLARGSLVPVRAQADARNITIDLRLPVDMLRVRGDRTRLLQVLINLLSNAVKFTPDQGRIVFCIRASERNELVFLVRDTGIGMTEAETAIALEPFSQVDNSLSRAFEGTGLGLPLARKLTELHGGRLELSSVKGKGTTAMVVLPAERLQRLDGGRT